MAWLDLTMPNRTVKNGLKAKKIKLPQINFFLNKQLINFSCTYWLLSFCNILKKLLGPIQSYENAPFLGPKWSICPKQIFFSGKLLISFSSNYYHLLVGKILINFFLLIQSYENAQFLGPKWPISPNETFFRKSLNELCFFRSCLSTCQKSKSENSLLEKYWRLKNTEISLAKRLFWL